MNYRSWRDSVGAGLLTPAEARSLEGLGVTAGDQRIIDRIRAADRATLALAGGERPFDARSEVAADGTPELMIYGPIGGWFGIWPEDVARELQAIGPADEVRVRLDSPGGYVFDGIAIYNLLRKHPANITVEVDAMAASIASVIAQAGDRIIMNRGSEMMIHQAWAGVIGNAAELRDYADFLDRQTLKVARIYTAEAGGTEQKWLDLMAAPPDGTWFLAQEAVEVGLAHEHEDAPTADEPGADAQASVDWAALLPFARRRSGDDQMSTDAAPDAAPDSSPDQAERQAVARQRRHAVARIRTDLVRSHLNRRK